MTTPTGFRVESVRTPHASRVGALHSHIHSHLYRQIVWAEGLIHRFGSRGAAALDRDAWMGRSAAMLLGGGS